jgi:alanine racemase
MGTLFQFPYRTVAEISIRAIIKNLVTLRSLSQREVVPVVKADAYGHGILPVSKALVSRGSCHTLCVATLEEAIELRKKIPYAISIWVLSGFLPHQLDAYLKYRLTPVIHSLNHLKSLLNQKRLPDIHLKIDTGMHRLGLLVEELPEVFLTIERLGIKLSGLATHFAESENGISKFVDEQIDIFHSVYQELLHRRMIQTDAKIHIANTGGIFRKKLGLSYSVRPGIGLYGISPNPRLANSEDLVPALSWKARVIAVKPIKAGDSVGYGRTYTAKRREKLAVVSIGYADGLPRLLSNEGSIILGGKKVSIRGRVSMDLTTVDCSAIPSIKEGSLVTLIGREGKVSVSAWDIANWARTIPYEILCGISPRVPRVYLD